MKPVGYCLMKPELVWEPGHFYTYFICRNGVFISAENELMVAEATVAKCQIRGLQDAHPGLRLKNGKIPQRLFDLALSVLMADCSKERYVAVVWDGGYRIVVPEQEGSAAHLEYSAVDSVVFDMHSHPRMGAFFSSEDNRDDSGLRVSAVVGHLEGDTDIRVRVGVYGYFHEIPWGDVFDGELQGCRDTYGEEDELVSHRILTRASDERPGLGSWLRRYRWLRR